MFGIILMFVVTVMQGYVLWRAPSLPFVIQRISRRRLIWPFSYLVRQRFPPFEGTYKLGSMMLIVSRGTGTWGPRMRLWYPVGILRLTLHAGPDPELRL